MSTTLDLISTATEPLTVRFDGREAYRIVPGLNVDVPAAIANHARWQHPDFVQRAKHEREHPNINPPEATPEPDEESRDIEETSEAGDDTENTKVPAKPRGRPKGKR